MDQRHQEKRAVGYVRVSTKAQGQPGSGFDRQTQIIRELAEASGYVLTKIYEDVASGMPDMRAKQPGLVAAINDAKAHPKTVILVASPHRLTRNPNLADALAMELPVLVVAAPGYPNVLDDKVRRELFSSARDVGMHIRSGTRNALRQRRNVGQTLGNPSALVAGRKSSAKTKRTRKAERTHELADYLRKNPASQGLTHRQLADELNARGIFSGWGRRWTKDGIRRPREAAMKELRERTEFEEEARLEEGTPFQTITENGQDKVPEQRVREKRSEEAALGPTGSHPRTGKPNTKIAADGGQDETDPIPEIYRSNPNFGRF